MAHPEVHSLNSVKKFGGSVEDYLPIHQWFDDSKAYIADMRHRAFKHHAAGIFECERVFGKSLVNSEGKTVYIRYIGEQHILEDLGFIPTLEDWFENMELQKWMMNVDTRIKKILKGEKLPKSLNRELL
ncbi:hypothetical protein P4H70_12200 [Paenibacillus ehimensis]|uniref:DUF6915 family protein n=1 Tax=Paenibacillus ehimensis TaxID=79264 RepID=UPI002DBDF294|nr:hypothetical protein [Paenibacillus ehimensis]MEC0209693.1 hypothetical protein [Paenibacillus ehimensis]